MQVALIQTDIAWNDPEANIQQTRLLIETACRGGANLVVLPEMFNSGFSLATGELAERCNRLGIQCLTDIARKLSIFCIGSLPEVADSGAVYNTAYVIGPQGIVTKYRKVHLFSFGAETTAYQPGDRIECVELGGVRVTPLICYDLRFPRLFSAAADRTDLFVVVANWPTPRREHWMTLLRARAIENQAFVIGVNRIGAGGNLMYSGNSMAFGPSGDLLVDLGSDANMKIVTVTSEEVQVTRSAFPTLRDRRLDLYAHMERYSTSK